MVRSISASWRSIFSALALAGLFVPSTDGHQAQPASDLVHKAEQSEREDRWSAAAEVYADLARRQPESAEWRQRLRRCQRQQAISRRYADGGAAGKMLRLSVDELIGLYGEVVTTIQGHYFEEPALDSLLSQGIEQVDLALRNRVFVAAVLPAGVSDETLSQQRSALRSRWSRLTAADCREAQRKVKAVALGLRQDLGARPSAVVLEFVYSACEALDPYGAYLPPDQFTLEKMLAEKTVAGIGIELGQGQEQIVITQVNTDSPAAGAGIQLNEQLVAIDGQSVRALNLEEATLRLFGPEGSRITLEVQAALDRQPRKIELVRQRLAIPTIADSQIVDREAGVGYIQLAAFQSSTIEELDTAIAKLGEDGMRVLILDLRGNRGGLFASAVQVADRFINTGILVTARGRSPRTTAVYRAQDQQVVTIPLVVLIDAETASGAEVVAGAIKDHRRGVLVGEKSAGKGAMQYIFPLHRVVVAELAGVQVDNPKSGDFGYADSGLRLTTAQLFSPLDYAYTGHGVLPDIVVDRVPEMTDPNSMMSMLQVQQLQYEAALREARALVATE